MGEKRGKKEEREEEKGEGGRKRDVKKATLVIYREKRKRKGQLRQVDRLIKNKKSRYTKLETVKNKINGNKKQVTVKMTVQMTVKNV
jgi:hypothetical protein